MLLVAGIADERLIEMDVSTEEVAADNEVILPYSEKLIDVYIQRFEDV